MPFPVGRAGAERNSLPSDNGHTYRAEVRLKESLLRVPKLLPRWLGRLRPWALVAGCQAGGS